jgi:23S rRNA (cytidine2498-2'-O)-methyltransferase
MPEIRSAYLAATGFHEPLAEELARRGAVIRAWHGDLALSEAPPVPAAWSLNTWLAPREIPFDSIGQAADSLRAIQRNWGSYQVEHFRRAALISAKLPVLRPKKLVFPQLAPAGHLGAWTLLAQDRMLASPAQSSAFINGANGRRLTSVAWI